jgi:hypothetical protein
VGDALLYPAGTLAGAWGAHEAYRAGQLIRDILSPPEKPTVDAAGAIEPVTQSPVAGSTALPQIDRGYLNGGQSSTGVFDTGAPPIPYLPSTLQDKPGGLLGMMIDAGQIDPSTSERPAAGGLPGLIHGYLRNNPGSRL